MKGTTQWKFYEKSKEIFREHEITIGFRKWEFYDYNFKLECWNMTNNKTKKIEPTIIQFWKNGNGYTIYRPQ